jgi:tetratricopeptide (TPR) repeat protein
VPFWRKKPKSTDHVVGEFGRAEINVTQRRGDLPLIDISLSLTPEYARGLEFQHKRDELGPHHAETLHALHRYAVALGEHPGRRDEAVELLGWLVDAGADAPENRLLALDDLTRLLQDGGNLALAEQRLREGLSGWERLRGRDDAKTLGTATNLAKVLLDLDRRDEAEPLMRDTVDRSARSLGTTHPDTLARRNVLAGALRGSPARLTEAERMYLALLDDIGSAGDDTTDLAMAVRHNLAAVLTHQGKHTEALELNRVLVEARSRQLGDDHPDTLVSRHNHAVVLNSLGHAAEAEPLLAGVLDDYRRVFGPRHAATLGVQVDLAALRANQGRNTEAVPLLSDAIEGYRSTHGPDHPLVRELTAVLAQLSD